MQEGGSSIEAYATSYDMKEDAEDARVRHARATYASAGPFPVDVVEIDGQSYITEGDALALAEAIRTANYEHFDDGRELEELEEET